MTYDGATLSVGTLLLAGRYEPARVQREYRWDEVQQTQLLHDLVHACGDLGASGPPDSEAPADELADEDADEDEDEDEDEDPAPRLPEPLAPVAAEAPPGPSQSYFLGSMILLRSRAAGLRYIYDGQQRLTTLTVLIAALRERLEGTPAAREAQALLLVDAAQPRLLAPTDGGLLRRIVRGARRAELRTHARRSHADELLGRAADLYRRRLQAWTPETCSRLLQFLAEAVYVTVTFIDDRRHAETAYLTVNNRGMQLSSADVVKGHVVRVVSEQRSAEEGRQVALAWNHVRRDADRWFEPLLRTVDFLQFGKPRPTDFGTDLMDLFDASPKGAARAKAWVLSDLPRYWSRFRQIADPGAHAPSDAVVPLRQLAFLPWTEWQAVALLLLDREPARKQAKRLRQLQRACFTMHLLGWGNHDEKRSWAFRSARDELRAGRSPFRQYQRGSHSRGPLWFGGDRRAQARGALASPMPDYAMYRPVVRWAETVLWLREAGEVPPFVGEGSVEHVLPRTHGRGWTQGFPDEEAREQAKNLLGNLCLVPNKLNRALGNAEFEAKRALLRDVKRSWRSAYAVASHRVWTQEVVEQRTRELADMLIDTLRIREPSLAGGGLR